MCLTVDEAAEVRDQARAVEAYYSQRADCLEIQNQAAAIRFRAERRIGEILRAMPKNKGGRPPETGSSETPVPTLAEIGITKKQASVWQRIAGLAEETFEERLAEAQENGLELTTSRVLGLSKPPAPAKPAKPASPLSAPEQRQQESTAALADLFRDVGELARRIARSFARKDIERLTSILAGLAATDEIAPEEP